MESRAKLLGHPVHQMLIPIPAGLFIVAALLDIVDLFVEASWIPTVTYWNLILGLGFAVLAAVFGIIDYTKIPKNTRARFIGGMHGLGNALAILLFALAASMRVNYQDHRAGAVSVTLEALAFGLLGMTAWLGGELVDRLGVGVDDGAHLDAPSSLRAKHVPGAPPLH